ncbi:MAG: molecular chaperone DnaJ [Gammaproteobacteria bacterium]|nr:molecular chaperone DnaJ [Gammaproteobacteria bacterium]
MIPLMLGLIAATALVVLLRLLWLSAPVKKSTLAITLATLALVAALAVLAATGRLHWLAAAAAALLPFLRRSAGLMVRFFPILGRLLAAFRQRRPGAAQPAAGAMTRQEALSVLGLKANATKQEVIEAHRRLMARNHPDKGGSTFIAQQLNEAKRVLIG